MKARRTLIGWWYALHYWGGLVFFALAIGLFQLFGVVGIVVSTGPRMQRGAKTLIRMYLRAYFFYLNSTAAFRGSFTGWKREFAETPGVIVANHPSMMDAPFFLSRLPQGICIFKAALGRSILRGRSASFVGYMHSEEGVDGLRQVIQAVRDGAQFVFFPEGTRTSATGEISLRPLYAVVAKFAHVPIHIFAIERNSNALCKDHRLSKVPELPADYRVRHVKTIAHDVAPTAALLHGAVKAVLMPIIEAHRTPVAPGLFAQREVIEQTPERVEWKLKMPRGPGFFAGHFPDHPIAPGAASVHWVEEAWAAGPGRGSRAVGLQRVRFLQEIAPGDEVRLVLECRNGRWKAELTTSCGLVSSANILEEVTG